MKILKQIQTYKQPPCPGCGKSMTLCLDTVDKKTSNLINPNRKVRFMAWYGCGQCRNWFTTTKFGYTAGVAATEAYNAAWKRNNPIE